MGNRWLRLLLVTLAACLCRQTCLAQESPAERRERVEKMLPGDKEHLLRLQERFAGLDRVEQDKLRHLNRELEQDPNATRLRQVMQRYYEWLKTLTPYQRIELSQMSPEKRIERIRKLMEEQRLRPPKLQETRHAEAIKKAVKEEAKRLGQQLETKDIGGLFDWITQVSERYAPRFLESLPESRSRGLRQQWENVKDPRRRRLIFAWLWMQWQAANPGKLPPKGKKDLAALRARLSQKTRDRLESKSEAEQWRTIADWMSLLAQENQERLASQRADELISEETEQNLAMFFEHVLTEEEKDRLLAMPSEQMFRELWREFTRAEVSKTPVRTADRAAAGKRPGALQGQRGKAAKPAQTPASTSGATKTPAPKPGKTID